MAPSKPSGPPSYILNVRSLKNKIPYDARHFIQTEIDSTDLKKSNLASKIPSKKRKQDKKVPYTVPTVDLDKPGNANDLDNVETIKALEDIASLQPGRNAHFAAKKISKKYQKIKEVTAKKK